MKFVYELTEDEQAALEQQVAYFNAKNKEKINAETLLRQNVIGYLRGLTGRVEKSKWQASYGATVKAKV